MAVTRINNNQITDASTGNVYVGINASTKVQDFSVTAGKLANSLVYGSDLTVSGNLTVNGQTTTIDTVSTVIEDPVIVLASNQTGTPAVDIGFIGERGDSDNIVFVWDESADEFVTAFTTDLVTNTTVTISSYANFHTNDANVGGNLTVGGNIDITGNVTSLNVTGNITGGNLLTPGVVTATGNVTGGNLSAGSGIISTTGNINGGNVNATAIVANTVTGGNVDATDFNGGNLNNMTLGTQLLTNGQRIAGGSFDYSQLYVGFDGGDQGIALNSFGNAPVEINTGDGGANTYNWTFSATNGEFAAPGDVTTTGNVNAGNLNATANLVSVGAVVTGNVTGGNLLTGGVISATGNVSGGNVTTAGQVVATGNITGGNLITSGTFESASISATGNVTGGNLITAGITSTGSLTASTTIDATGNITGGNVSAGSGIISTTGNIDGANVNASAGITAGTTVTATGNVTGGNIATAGQVVATGNVSGGNVISPTVTGGAGTLTLDATGDVVFAQSGNINATTSWINNLVDPVQAQDAATKQYVDDAVSTGITIHTPVRLESPTDIGGAYAQGGTTATVTDTVADNTVVFSSAIDPQVNDQLWFTNSFNGVVANTPYFVVSAPNTSAAVLSLTYSGTPVTTITSGSGLTQGVRINSGQGATLTNSGANVTLVIDGVTVANADRVLVYQQANAVHNGVYVVSEAGNATTAWQLTRSDDMDTYAPDDINGLDAGDYFYVTSGDTGAGESYVMTAPIGPTIIGYDNLTFTQFSASQVYTANTAAGLALNGTVFSAKVDGITTAFDGSGNIIVKASADLTTPNIGAATGTSLNVTGNVTGGNLTTTGITSTGSLTASTTIDATGNITGGNVSAGSGIISTTGNIDGANVNASAGITAGTTIAATGNITGGNLTTTGITSTGSLTATTTIAATGNITGGNVSAGAGIISTTGNIDGGNINATGNVNGTGAVFSGNVTASNFIGNISGNIDAGGANTNIQFNDGDILAGSAAFTFDKTSNAVAASGNITGGNIDTAGQVVATGNVTGGNLITAGLASITGNVTGGNLTTAGQVVATGNVTGGNVVAVALVTGANVTASANVTGANVIGTTAVIGGNIVISGDDITDTNGRVNFNTAGADVDFAVNGDTVANVFYVDAGTGTASFGSATQTTNAVVAFNATNSVLMPVGNVAQRPDTGVTGMLRFNTTADALEVYDNNSWTTVGVPSFTVIADEQFNGDGSTVAFTLGSEQTTASCIVSINGVVQIPTIAYSVSGTTLTFTEAPEPGDIIDVRQITTTTSVTSISNLSGNATITVSDTSNDVSIDGDLIPTSNVTQNIGSNTARWNELWLAGSTIVLGNTVIKNTSGNSIGFFGPDGTTPATIDASSVDTTQIASGTSSVAVVASGGNIRANVGGSTVGLFTSSGVQITGDLSVTGNATLSGNILGDRIQNGTTQIDIQTINGNANITVGGVANVAVFSTAGANITGTLGVTGNITGGNLSGTSIVGTLTTASQPNITSVGTLSSLAVTGNTSSGNFVGTLNGSGANVTSISATNISTGTLAQARLANAAVTLGSTALTLGATVTTVAGLSSVTSTTFVGALTGAATTAGTVTTAAQPNITSVGTLSSLAVTGNTSSGNFVGTLNGSGANVTSISATNISSGTLAQERLANSTLTLGSTTLTLGATTTTVAGLSSVTSTTFVGDLTGAATTAGTVTTAAQPNITSVGTLSSVTVTANVAGGNITTAGQVVATGNVTGGNLITAGLVSLSSITKTGSNGVGNIGSSTSTFNTIFAKATSAQYADLAEKYVADTEYAPGTVVVFGGAKEVTVSSTDADRAVAGVVSTNPSYIMNSGLEAEYVATVALTGRVPCRVTGTVRKGDLMVSAGYGLARAEQDPRVGTVIGKALENHEGTEGVIEVVVGRF